MAIRHGAWMFGVPGYLQIKYLKGRNRQARNRLTRSVPHSGPR
jgi:hypothetical protein